jgi:hypothetical protein
VAVLLVLVSLAFFVLLRVAAGRRAGPTGTVRNA